VSLTQAIIVITVLVHIQHTYIPVLWCISSMYHTYIYGDYF